jgi:hypothetical protein
VTKKSLPGQNGRKEAPRRVPDSFCHEHVLTCHRKDWGCHFSIDLIDGLQSASLKGGSNGGSDKSVENVQMSARHLFSALRASSLLEKRSTLFGHVKSTAALSQNSTFEV